MNLPTLEENARLREVIQQLNGEVSLGIQLANAVSNGDHHGAVCLATRFLQTVAKPDVGLAVRQV